MFLPKSKAKYNQKKNSSGSLAVQSNEIERFGDNRYIEKLQEINEQGKFSVVCYFEHTPKSKWPRNSKLIRVLCEQCLKTKNT